MSIDLLLGRISPNFARGVSGPSRASESVALLSLFALALAPGAARLVEREAYRTTYRRESRPTREVPMVPMLEMVKSRSASPDIDYSPRMYRGDMRRTRELPLVEVSRQVERVYEGKSA